MRIAVCDDDMDFLSDIKELLGKIWQEEDNHILCFRSGEELLSACQSGTGNFDVVFLDIELEGQDGIAIGKQLKAIDEELLLIFLTNYEKYAVKGYEAKAFRYLLKPLNESVLQHVLNEIKRENRRKHVLQFSVEGGEVLLPISKILYIESHEKYTTIYADNGRYLSRKSLNAYEMQLAHNGFYRIHRKYLVNLYRVNRLRNFQVEIEGNLLPVGRRRQTNFRETLYRFLEKGLTND